MSYEVDQPQKTQSAVSKDQAHREGVAMGMFRGSTGWVHTSFGFEATPMPVNKPPPKMMYSTTVIPIGSHLSTFNPVSAHLSRFAYSTDDECLGGLRTHLWLHSHPSVRGDTKQPTPTDAYEFAVFQQNSPELRAAIEKEKRQQTGEIDAAQDDIAQSIHTNARVQQSTS